MKLFRRLPVLALLCLLAVSVPVFALDIVVTAANVKQVSGTPQVYTAGGTITAGQSLYLNSSNQAVTAKADTSADAACIGISLNGASTGQPVSVLTSGVINIGGTVVVGTPYVVSNANAGGIAPWSDLTTGAYVTFIGYGSTANNITMSLQVTGLKSP